MNRALRFVLMLAVALGLVPFIPLYIERTMLRSWLMNPPGTVIEWGWKVCSLREYWSNYSYITREQKPALWLAVNLALAVIYALVIAVGIDQFSEAAKENEGNCGLNKNSVRPSCSLCFLGESLFGDCSPRRHREHGGGTEKLRQNGICQNTLHFFAR